MDNLDNLGGFCAVGAPGLLGLGPGMTEAEDNISWGQRREGTPACSWLGRLLSPRLAPERVVFCQVGRFLKMQNVMLCRKFQIFIIQFTVLILDSYNENKREDKEKNVYKYPHEIRFA